MADAADCLSRARQCLQAREFDTAEHLLRAAIAQDPQLALAYELLGKVLYRDARAEEAAAVYRAWLQALPGDPVATHLVAATGGAAAPERASDGFVRRLFDRAAPDFDAALASLGYCAPQLIFETATSVLDADAGALGADAGALDILDLGCGTGLCGTLFRPRAHRLVGVDLSDGMLEQARRRGCYDELVCEELTAYLDRCVGRFHVITAADVFCYFGDLLAPLSEAARSLRSGGWLVFSVEELQSSGVDVNAELLEHGRYAHSRSYIANTLVSLGLRVSVRSTSMLRFERGAPVEGLIVAAQAPVSGALSR
jgi:predicted TPR repeat methyltransferase